MSECHHVGEVDGIVLLIIINTGSSNDRSWTSRQQGTRNQPSPPNTTLLPLPVLKA